jgi:putative nucleotidyltransferase with HDIG domain
LETTLRNLKTWFEEYVRGFDSPDPDVQKNMDLKTFHTHRVCENILDIGKSLDLSPLDLMLSETSALLHDIGRFEQYRRYRTFVDKKSENHAALGVKIIRENRLLDGVDPALADIILRAVACHNRLAIPAEGDARFLMILKMLRDADKLDIWRVVTEYYRSSSGNRNQALELDLPDTEDISDPIREALMHGGPVQMTDLRTLNDFKLLQIGWVYDINFPRSFRIILEKGYIEAIRNALSVKSGRVEEIYRRVRAYLEKNTATPSPDKVHT